MSDTNLRAQLIRLAHEHPEFRKDILPLVKEAAAKPDLAEMRDPFHELGMGYKLYLPS